MISFSDAIGGSESHVIKFTSLMEYSFYWAVLKTSNNAINSFIKSNARCLGYKNLNHTSKLNLLSTFISISKIIKHQNISTIYAIGFLPSLLSCTLRIFKPSLRIITTRRESMTWISWFHYPFLWFINLMSHKIETNSIYLNNKIKKEPFTKAKLYYLPNILSDNVMNPILKKNFFTELESFQYVIGLVANVRPPKNISMFIKISEIILADYDNVCFALVGKDSKDKLIGQLIKDRKLHKNFFFYDDVDISEIGNFYKMINIFIFTSINEGNPNVISEAMAYGLPIISSDIPAIHPLLQEEENAFLCSPNDLNGFVNATKRLISNPLLCDYMSKENKKKSKIYSKKDDIKKILKIAFESNNSLDN